MYLEPIDSYQAPRRGARDPDSVRLFDEYIPNEDVASLFGMSDLVVLPYRIGIAERRHPLAAMFAEAGGHHKRRRSTRGACRDRCRRIAPKTRGAERQPSSPRSKPPGAAADRRGPVESVARRRPLSLRRCEGEALRPRRHLQSSRRSTRALQSLPQPRRTRHLLKEVLVVDNGKTIDYSKPWKSSVTTRTCTQVIRSETNQE